MSGGHFDYKEFDLKNEIFGYVDKPETNVFEDREITEIVWDTLDLIYHFDWYKSGDTSEEDWLEAKGKFKDKWLKADSSDRVKRIIDESVEDLKDELYKTFINQQVNIEEENNDK